MHKNIMKTLFLCFSTKFAYIHDARPIAATIASCKHRVTVIATATAVSIL